MSYKGRYIVQNRDKYQGDVDNVIYRSLWERKVMRYLDESENVIKWGSEEIVIPYVIKNEKGEIVSKHRYYPDFYAEFKDGNKYIIEVKPFKQTQPPKLSKSGRKTRRTYIEEITYRKNVAKWEAAATFCEENSMHFKILTEIDLGLIKKKQPQ